MWVLLGSVGWLDVDLLCCLDVVVWLVVCVISGDVLIVLLLCVDNEFVCDV